MSIKINKRIKRHKRIRSRMFGTAQRPRLSVFKSNKHIYGQLIDDENIKIIAASGDLDIKKGSKTEKSKEVGKLIAKKAQENKITEVVFDRAGFPYHGRIKALAEGAREAGLKF
jgi:large subunit ribosomal protein L18